jgi:hypothetical protein
MLKNNNTMNNLLKYINFDKYLKVYYLYLYLYLNLFILNIHIC